MLELTFDTLSLGGDDETENIPEGIIARSKDIFKKSKKD